MSIYDKIYERLCESRKQNKQYHKPGSGIHCHHIIPKHMGGADDESNFTYLTPREHTIAHFLLWKIHRNPNDLRSMRMLGAKLSVEKRRIIGLWCVENKIGIHGFTKEMKSEASRRAGKSSFNNKSGFHNPEMANEYRKNAGKQSGKKSWEKKTQLFDEKYDQLRSVWASNASKALWEKRKGSMMMTDGSLVKRVLRDDIQTHLDSGWVKYVAPKKRDETTKRIYINNGIQNKMVLREDAEKWFDDGWVRGMLLNPQIRHTD